MQWSQTFEPHLKYVNEEETSTYVYITLRIQSV